MTAIPSTPEPGDQHFHEWATKSGLLNAVFQGMMTSCSKEDDAHKDQFDHDLINDRAGGHNRWHSMDNELIHIAPLFGMDIIWVQPTLNPRIKMLFLRRGKHLLSCHRVDTQGNCAPHALHREAIKEVMEGLFGPQIREANPDTIGIGPRKIGSNEYIYTPDQLIDLVENEGLTHWTYTYERSMSRIPRWAILGKPIKGFKKLAQPLDVMRTLKFIHPEDSIIDLNPGPDTPPPPRFGTPNVDKPEGED